jgi:hypothetical protein
MHEWQQATMPENEDDGRFRLAKLGQVVQSSPLDAHRHEERLQKRLPEDTA